MGTTLKINFGAIGLCLSLLLNACSSPTQRFSGACPLIAATDDSDDLERLKILTGSGFSPAEAREKLAPMEELISVDPYPVNKDTVCKAIAAGDRNGLIDMLYEAKKSRINETYADKRRERLREFERKYPGL